MTTTDETTPDLAEATTALIRSYFATVDRLIDDLTDALGIDCDNLVNELDTLAAAAEAEPEDDGWQDATVEALNALPVGTVIECRSTTPDIFPPETVVAVGKVPTMHSREFLGLRLWFADTIASAFHMFRIEPGTVVGRTYPDGAAVAAAVRSRELPHDAVLRRDNDIGWHHFARSVVDSYAEPFTVVHAGSGLS
jgi:hypothetical protein